MGIYPDRRTHSHQHTPGGGETWIQVERTPGLTRTRVVTAGQWHEDRTDCFCCSCGDREGDDMACRNHGYWASRPCEKHNMPGAADEDGEMPESVQERTRKMRERLEIERRGEQ